MITDNERDELTNRLTGFDVVELLGLETQESRGKTYVLCPAHIHRLNRYDENFGNAVVTDTGVYCYACGNQNIFDLVMDTLNVSYPEAVRFLQGHLNIDPNDAKKTNLFPFSKDELRFIGIVDRRNVVITCVDEQKPNKGTFVKEYINDIPYFLKTKKTDSYIRSFWEESPKEFYQFVRSKAVQQYVNLVLEKEELKKYRCSPILGPIYFNLDKDIQRCEKILEVIFKRC